MHRVCELVQDVGNLALNLYGSWSTYSAEFCVSLLVLKLHKTTQDGIALPKPQQDVLNFSWFFTILG